MDRTLAKILLFRSESFEEKMTAINYDCNTDKCDYTTNSDNLTGWTTAPYVCTCTPEVSYPKSTPGGGMTSSLSPRRQIAGDPILQSSVCYADMFRKRFVDRVNFRYLPHNRMYAQCKMAARAKLAEKRRKYGLGHQTARRQRATALTARSTMTAVPLTNGDDAKRLRHRQLPPLLRPEPAISSGAIKKLASKKPETAQSRHSPGKLTERSKTTGDVKSRRRRTSRNRRGQRRSLRSDDEDESEKSHDDDDYDSEADRRRHSNDDNDDEQSSYDDNDDEYGGEFDDDVRSRHRNDYDSGYNQHIDSDDGERTPNNDDARREEETASSDDANYSDSSTTDSRRQSRANRDVTSEAPIVKLLKTSSYRFVPPGVDVSHSGGNNATENGNNNSSSRHDDGSSSAVVDGRFVLIQAVVEGTTRTLYTLPADDQRLSESLRKLKTNDFRWHVMDEVTRSRDKEVSRNRVAGESVGGIFVKNSFAEKSVSRDLRRSRSLTPTSERYDSKRQTNYTDLEYNTDSDSPRKSRSRTMTRVYDEFPVNETRTCLKRDCVDCRKGNHSGNGGGRRHRRHHASSNRRQENEVERVAIASFQHEKSALGGKKVERRQPTENKMVVARAEDLNLVGRTVSVRQGPRMLACKT